MIKFINTGENILNDKTKYSLQIKPESGWQFVDLRELIKYKDMLFFLVWRDIKARYAQSALGFGWAVISPVVQMVIFTIIFGYLANISSDGVPYPIFSYTALVPWTFFGNALGASSRSMIGAISLIGKVYFPRLILPIAAVLDKFVDFSIALVLLFFLMLMFKVVPTIWILFVPVLILIMILAASGLGLLASAFAIQYRDVAYGMEFGVRVMMYLSPVIYPVSIVPEQLRLLYGLNPMVGIIEGFRSALLGTNPMPWDLIALSTIMSVIFFIIGLALFQRRQHIFADVV